MRRTAATLVVTAGLLAGSVGQAAAIGSWAEEPVPAPDGAGKLTAADSARGESWAFGYAGDDSEPGSRTATVYRKDQQGWQRVPIDDIGPLHDGAVIAPDDAWTIGGPGTSAHWDGREWTRIELAARPGENAQPLALKAFAPDDVWTVGHTDAEQGSAQHWDGRAWTNVPVPAQDGGYSLVDAEGVASNDLWAVGNSTSRGVALHWDGSAWTEVPAPDVNADPAVPEGLTSILTIGSDDVWVGGYSGEVGHEVPYTAHWNGTEWQVVDLTESGKVTELIQVGDQVQLFGIGPNLEPFWYGLDNGEWLGKLAPPAVRVEGATVQEDGALLGVGHRFGSVRMEPYTATYHE